MSAAPNLDVLIAQTANYDKDERYMATNDLCNLLQREVRIDEATERKICVAILKQLDDPSNDVQSVAVKCLAILVKKVHAAQIGDICDKLVSLILDGPDDLRDIYSIGLKTLISDANDEMGQIICDRLVNKLVHGVTRQGNDESKRECVDNLNDLLRRFGTKFASEHETLLIAVVRLLDNDKPIIRKRVAICLGSLAAVLSDPLLNRLIESLLPQLNTKQTLASATSPKSPTRTLIQTIGTISRSVGHRLGRFLNQLVPIFIHFCGDSNDENQQSESYNELREHCLPGLELFVLHCQNEILPYINNIIRLAITFAKYDPNYCYDESDSMDVDEDAENNGYNGGEDGDDGDYVGDDDEDEYAGSGDDDDSWKVRKAALKLLSAVFRTRVDLTPLLLDTCLGEVVSRFQEREESVRIDVITCFNDLLGTCQRFVKRCASSSDAETAVKMIRSHLDASRIRVIIKLAKKQFSGNSDKTKSALFLALKQVSLTVKDALCENLEHVLSFIDSSINSRNQLLKLDALLMLSTLLTTHSNQIMRNHIDRIVQTLQIASRESWFKIISESLRTVSALVSVIRTDQELQSGIYYTEIDTNNATNTLFELVTHRLRSQDVDQDSREQAILASAKLLHHCGDRLSHQVNTVLSLLNSRLDNEMTRSAVLKALIMIAQSPIKIDVSCLFPNTVRSIANLLRQQNRALKLQSLEALNVLLSTNNNTTTNNNNTNNIIINNVELVEFIAQECASLLSDSDLNLTLLSLQILTQLTLSGVVTSNTLTNTVYPRLQDLALSPSVQGNVTIKLAESLSVLTSQGVLDRGEVVQQLYTLHNQHRSGSLVNGKTLSVNLTNPSNSKQSLHNIAVCIAAIVTNSDKSFQTTTVSRFLSDLEMNDLSNTHKALALYCIGELGRTSDLSNIAMARENILACLDNGSEEVKVAASAAFGSIAIGNMEAFLPTALDLLRRESHMYFALSALKDILSFHAMHKRSMEHQGFLTQIHQQLDHLSHCEEENIRYIVSDCIGILLTLHDTELLPWIQTGLASSSDASARWTACTAVKHALSRKDISHQNVIFANLESFVSMLKDADLEVRRAVLQLENAAFFYHPEVSKSLVEKAVPSIVETLAFKQEKVVDLGPFKHKIDEGLPLRKSALTCIETILNAYGERMDVKVFIDPLPSLLSDTEEIRTQVCQVIIKLCGIAPLAMTAYMSAFIEPMEKILNKKPNTKEGESHEADRAMEIIRSCLRAIDALSKIEDTSAANGNPAWAEFMDRVKKAGYTMPQ